MGDRGNIFVTSAATGGVYLYTHWRGSEIADVAAAALRKRERWDDAQYLARIVFHELTGGTSGGISARLLDNEHPIVVIDVDVQVAGLARAYRWTQQLNSCYVYERFESFIGDDSAVRASWEMDW